MNFDQLAQATIELGESLNLVDKDRSFKIGLSSKTTDNFQNYPETPGLIYFLNRGASTFTIKGFCSENLKHCFSKINSGDENFLKSKNIDGDNLDKLCFFETKIIEHADLLKEKLFNRRFPIFEQSVCNVSDPGFSWWVESGPSELKIYFKSYGGSKNEQELIKLGPMGDSSFFQAMIERFVYGLKNEMPCSEFSFNQRQMRLTPVDEFNIYFKELRDVIKSGKHFSKELSDFLEAKVGKSLKLFLDEFSVSRLFWLEIEKKLEQN